MHDAAARNSPAASPRARRAALSFAGALILALAACTIQGQGLPPIPDTDATVYRLGPGDRVRIITFGDQDLSGQFRIDAAGLITLPLLGSVHAGGMTEAELQTAIADQLIKLDIFKKPSVSIEILDYRPIFVLGEVAKPGEYPYQPGMTVLTAVAVAGGFTYRAVKDQFSIVRANEGQKMEGVAKRQTMVAPGDVIDVFERSF